MPILSSDYSAPKIFKNPIIHSIYALYVRPSPQLEYARTTIPTLDKQFLVIDEIKSSSKKNVAILCHGLSGNSNSSYIRSMANTLHTYDWSVAVLNNRGMFCNTSIDNYHVGDTTDIAQTIKYFSSKNYVENIILLGFSMGGNILLKYLGEKGSKISPKIKAAIAYSSPIDVPSAADECEKKPTRWICLKVLRDIQEKLSLKRDILKSHVDIDRVLAANNWKEFDNSYIAKLHSFENYKDYRINASSKPFLNDIKVKTLIISARDDPALSIECYPKNEIKNNLNIFCEYPKTGGHLGFLNLKTQGIQWTERRALSFIKFVLKL